MGGEESGGGVVHATLLLRGDLEERAAVIGVLPVLDFGEINCLLVTSDDVDFVGFGLVIMGEEGVAALLEVINDEIFGALAEAGGRAGERRRGGETARSGASFAVGGG